MRTTKGTGASSAGRARTTRFGAFGAAFAMLASGVLAVGLTVVAPAAPLAAAPGTPGVPQPATTVYSEDLQNVTGPSPILRLTGYTGAAGMTYTADPAWLSRCNGWIAAGGQSTTAAAQIADCGTQGIWNSTQQLSVALGMFTGQTAVQANGNYAVSAFTSGNPGAPKVEFETTANVPFVAANRFINFSVDVAAVNCPPTASAPLLQFSLLNSAGVATPVGTQINACTSTGSVATPAVGLTAARTIKVGTYTAGSALLFSGSSVGVRMVNNNASGGGNDHAFDNIQILDVTPQLDKAFSPQEIPLHGKSTLTFTITNTSELSAKPGWSFTDTLPANLTVASPAVTSTTCTSGVVTAPAGGSTLTVSGNLNAGQQSCTVSVEVTAAAVGSYQNCAGNVTNMVGINPPACASLTCTDYTGELPDFFVTCPAPAEPQPVNFAIRQRWQTAPITISYQTPVVGDLYGTGEPMAVVAANASYFDAGSVDDRMASGLNIIRARDGVVIDTIATPRFGWSGHAAVALADVDGDGLGEIVLKASDHTSVPIAERGRLIAYHYDSGVGDWLQMWVSDQRYDNAEAAGRSGASIGFADFNADGVPEVYVGNQVFNASTGARLVAGTTAQSSGCPYRAAIGCFWSQTTAVDMDDDGQLELVAGDVVYDVDITNTAGSAGNSLTIATQAAALAGVVGDGWPAVADMDLDGRPDVVVVRTTDGQPAGQTRLYVYDGQTGAIKGSRTNIGVTGGPPLIGDIDGDGAPEIVFQNQNALRAFDFVPGTGLVPKWSIVTADGSGETSLSMFDFNNDGRQELVYRDEANLRIIDGSGATAVTRALFPCISGTATELPVIADIDGSGEARILVTCRTGATTDQSRLRAFETASEPWANTRPVWNQQAYFAAHINNDLTVPAAQAPHWMAFDDPTMACSDGVNRPFNSFQQQMTDLDPNTGCAVICEPPVDYGDAPLSYETTQADDGARHQIPDYDPNTGTAPLTLGTQIDLEPDGVPSPGADSDGADEDGVATPVQMEPDLPTAVTVSATNNTNTVATLAGWIDLDGDGAFEPAELMTAAVPANSGTANYVLTFAANAALADTYARFRLFPGAVVTPLPTALATAGEVEDYLVVAVPRPALELVKSATPASVGPVGSLITYSFVVTNTGNVTLTDVTVDDDEDEFSGTGTPPVPTCPAAAASLAPDASVTCTATYILTQADVDTGLVTNSATATGTPPDPLTPPPISPPDGFTVVIPPAPGLSLVKSANPNDADSFNLDQVITYSFVATNTGNVTLTDVGVSETDFDGTGTPPTITCPAPGNGAITLATQEQVICTATYTLTQLDVDAGTLFNEAVATGTPPDEIPFDSAPDDETLPGDPDPAITISKTASPITTATAGHIVTYTFVATNTGNVTLTGVAIEEGAFTGEGDLSAIVCPSAPATTLLPGQTLTCTATYTLTQLDIDTGVITNDATATGQPPIGTPTTSPPDGAIVTIVPAPSLTVDKSANPTSASEVGDVIAYSFVVTNTGNVTLTNARPTETAFTGTGGSPAIVCPPAPATTLLPGQTVTCTASYTLTQADVDAGEVTNSATATGTPPDPLTPPPVSPPDGVTVTVPPAPSLTIDKSANPTSAAEVGDVIAYSFLVTNTGNVTLTNVAVDDTFSGTARPLNVLCPVGALSLAPAATVTCTASYTLTQADVDAGEVTNSATATGTPPDPLTPPPVSPPDQVTVTVPPAPALTIDKSANPTSAGEVGDVIGYSFLVTNTGNVTLTNVGVTDTFSGSAGPLTVLCPAGAASMVPNATVTCTANYTLTQADVDAGEVTNSATTTGTPPDPLTPPPVSPPDQVIVTVDPEPSLTIVKSASPNDSASFNVGQVITYSFVATNTGNVTLTGVSVDDDAAAFTGSGPLGPIACPAPGNGNVTLAPQQQLTCTATYTLTQADVDATSLTNAATATGIPPDPLTPPPTSPPGVVTIPGDPEPAITVDKTVSPSTTAGMPGDVIVYSFLITNTGNVTLTDAHPVDLAAAFTGTGGPLAIVCPPAPATTLLPGQTVTCTASYALTQADVDAGEVTNAATATGTPPGTLVPPVSPPDLAVIVITPQPKIAIVKSVAPNTPAAFNVGQLVTYSFVATNEGNVTLEDVTVNEGTFTGSGPLSPVTCPAPGNGNITLAPGTQVICTATYTITQADVDAGSLTNTATSTGTPPDPLTPPPTSPPGGVTFPGDPQPAITVDKLASPASGGAVGDLITYSFLITNTGNVTLTDVRPVEGPFTGTGTPPAITCPAAPATTLVPGQTVTCTAPYTLTQADVDTGKVTNSATATGTPPDPLIPPPVAPPDEFTVVIPAAPALLVVKTAGPAIGGEVGDTITYSFEMTNTGNVTLTDVHPVEGPFTGSGTMSPVTCPLEAATMAPGDVVTCTASYTLTQADVDAGEVTNSATATGTPPDPLTPPPVSPPDQVTVTVPPAPALTIVKTANPATVVAAGTRITYAFSITNTGNTTLTNVHPVEGTFTGTGTLSAITCPPAAASVLPGAQISCTATYVTTQADVDAGAITNTATATGIPPGGITPPTSPPSTATVTSEATGALTLTKSAAAVDSNGNGITDIGDQINWTITVTNIGSATVTGITVSDPTAGPVTCPATTLAPTGTMICTTAPHTITAADAAAGQVRNVATAAGTGIDGASITPPPAEAQIAVQLVIPPPPPATPTTITPDPGELPATGGNSTSLLQIVLLLAFVGGGLVVIARRRKRPAR